MTDYWESVDGVDEALDRICATYDKAGATLHDVDRLLQDLHYEPTWRVLEVGCGVGRLIMPLRQIFRIVDGIDVSQKMVDLSRTYTRGRINGGIWKNDGSTIPLSGSSYDFVFAFTVFQHIRSVQVFTTYLREMRRVLRIGGRVRYQMHEVNEQFGRWEEDPNTVWGNAYTADELKGLTVAAGFSDVEVIEEAPWVWITAVKS
jgi:ubiquinone/menaquinone biosynthesis C-methylase UbiE